MLGFCCRQDKCPLYKIGLSLTPSGRGPEKTLNLLCKVEWEGVWNVLKPSKIRKSQFQQKITVPINNHDFHETPVFFCTIGSCRYMLIYINNHWDQNRGSHVPRVVATHLIITRFEDNFRSEMCPVISSSGRLGWPAAKCRWPTRICSNFWEHICILASRPRESNICCFQFACGCLDVPRAYQCGHEVLASNTKFSDHGWQVADWYEMARSGSVLRRSQNGCTHQMDILYGFIMLSPYVSSFFPTRCKKELDGIDWDSQSFDADPVVSQETIQHITGEENLNTCIMPRASVDRGLSHWFE